MRSSLFILSLPRSLSSLVHEVSVQALGYQEPTWTRAGEILNADRFVFFRDKGTEDRDKLLRREANPAVFDQMQAFLDQVVQREGFVYKSVTQAFLLADWLPKQELKVLKIKHNIADVTYSMLEKKWLYPTKIAKLNTVEERALIEGLLMAQQALDSIEGEEVNYEDLIQEEEHLFNALQSLYPHQSLSPISYHNERFVNDRYYYLKRRTKTSFKRLADRVQKEEMRFIAYGQR